MEQNQELYKKNKINLCISLLSVQVKQENMSLMQQ